MADFATQGIFEGFNFEQAARVFRLSGDFESAEKFADKGLALAKDFPVYLAALYVEKALALRSMTDEKWVESANQAIALYDLHQCPMRVELLNKTLKSWA